MLLIIEDLGISGCGRIRLPQPDADLPARGRPRDPISEFEHEIDF